MHWELFRFRACPTPVTDKALHPKSINPGMGWEGEWLLFPISESWTMVSLLRPLNACSSPCTLAHKYPRVSPSRTHGHRNASDSRSALELKYTLALFFSSRFRVILLLGACPPPWSSAIWAPDAQPSGVSLSRCEAPSPVCEIRHSQRP